MHIKRLSAFGINFGDPKNTKSSHILPRCKSEYKTGKESEIDIEESKVIMQWN